MNNLEIIRRFYKKYPHIDVIKDKNNTLCQHRKK